MGAAILPLAVAATGLKVFGAIQEGKAADKMGKYNAAVAENNALIERQNATWAGQQGEVNAATQEMQTRANVAEQTTQQAASGINVNKGSAVDVRASTAALGRMDAMNIRANAARQAYGHQTEAENYKAQAQLERTKGKQAKKASYIKAATTLLSNLASAGSNMPGGDGVKEIDASAGQSPWGTILSGKGIGA